MSSNPYDQLVLQVEPQRDGQHTKLSLFPKPHYLSGTDPDEHLARMTYMAGVVARAGVSFLARTRAVTPVDHERYERDPTLGPYDRPEHEPCSGETVCGFYALVDSPSHYSGQMSFGVTVPAAFTDEAKHMLTEIVKQIAEHDTRLILNDAELTTTNEAEET